MTDLFRELLDIPPGQRRRAAHLLTQFYAHCCYEGRWCAAAHHWDWCADRTLPGLADPADDHLPYEFLHCLDEKKQHHRLVYDGRDWWVLLHYDAYYGLKIATEMGADEVQWGRLDLGTLVRIEYPSEWLDGLTKHLRGCLRYALEKP